MTGGIKSVSLDVGGVIVSAAGFRDIGTYCGELDGMLGLLNLRTKFWMDPACSDEETTRLDVPVCSSLCGSADSISCIFGTSLHLVEIVYVVSELTSTFLSLNVAWFDVLGVFFETGVAVGVDDVVNEWRRIGSVNGD